LEASPAVLPPAAYAVLVKRWDCFIGNLHGLAFYPERKIPGGISSGYFFDAFGFLMRIRLFAGFAAKARWGRAVMDVFWKLAR